MDTGCWSKVTGCIKDRKTSAFSRREDHWIEECGLKLKKDRGMKDDRHAFWATGTMDDLPFRISDSKAN
jgi:hypothetical protein